MTNIKEISEQAEWIRQKSESIGWSNNKPVPEWEAMKEGDWGFDSTYGFYRNNEDGTQYRITTVSSNNLTLKKYLEGRCREALIHYDPETENRYGGSESIKLDLEEIYNVLYSLHHAITFHLDPNKDFDLL